MLTRDLLRLAAGQETVVRISGSDAASTRQLEWLVAAGLGPLLQEACQTRSWRVPEPWRKRLESEALTARLRHSAALAAALDVVDTARSIGVRPTLLKGISVAEQFYPRGDLRPMGDVDVLVPVEDRDRVERALVARGFAPQPDYDSGGCAHHGIPLRHPGGGAWVEVHTALFPESEDARAGNVFAPARIATLRVPSELHGRPVLRLTAELQLVYTAYSWTRDLTIHGIHASFLASLFDMVFLLKAEDERLDWDAILGWLDSELAVASLYTAMAYLHRHAIWRSQPVLQRLAAAQKIVGPVQLWLIHKTLDAFLLGARPLSSAVRFPVPGRFSIRHQLQKRQLRRPPTTAPPPTNRSAAP
jgi:hypothetical protein